MFDFTHEFTEETLVLNTFFNIYIFITYLNRLLHSEIKILNFQQHQYMQAYRE